MALSIYALASLDDLKKELHLSTAADAVNDPRMERVMDRASEIIEEHCHRKLVYRQTPYVEYHTVKEPRSILYLLDKPIVSITEVREDATLNWTSSPILTPNADYIASMLEGKITRTSGSVPINWFYVGIRTVRVVYVAGYEPLSGGSGACPAIPDTLKSVALSLAALMWREIDRKKQGLQSESTGVGSTTRYSAAMLTDWMADYLEPFVYEPLYPTGERDS